MNQTHQLPYAQHTHQHILKSIKLFAAYQSDESDGIKFGFSRLSVRQSGFFILLSIISFARSPFHDEVRAHMLT